MLLDHSPRVRATLPNGVSDHAEQTERLLNALFELVCKHLNLDPGVQREVLKGTVGFDLLQTLEEDMHPEFSYSGIIDEDLLRLVR